MRCEDGGGRRRDTVFLTENGRGILFQATHVYGNDLNPKLTKVIRARDLRFMINVDRASAPRLTVGGSAMISTPSFSL
jgi:DNA-binding MarR family transcriptional regulator